jgi:hypothetical protein
MVDILLRKLVAGRGAERKGMAGREEKCPKQCMHV